MIQAIGPPLAHVDRLPVRQIAVQQCFQVFRTVANPRNNQV